MVKRDETAQGWDYSTAISLSRAGHMDHCRVVLNKATGLDVSGTGDMEKDLARFHRALLAMTPEQRADIEARAAAGEL